MSLGRFLPARLRYYARLATREPRRYRTLLGIVYRRRPRVIVEIGTHRGQNAIQMIQTASVFHRLSEIQYIGFDLFEELTREELEREFSLEPPPYEQVRKTLESLGASVRLFQGYSQDTLPRFVEDPERPKEVDFVFVDGGHSIETIASDWASVRRLMSAETVVVFDDYYLNDESELPGVGCQSLIDGLDRDEFDVAVLEPEERFQHDWGVLRIKMASVRLRPDLLAPVGDGGSAPQ